MKKLIGFAFNHMQWRYWFSWTDGPEDCELIYWIGPVGLLYEVEVGA